MKKEKCYILIRRNHKNYKLEKQGRILEVDGIKLAIIGDSKTFYNLTHFETGMNLAYFDTLKECKNRIPFICERLKNMPDEFFKQGLEWFQKAEILD